MVELIAPVTFQPDVHVFSRKITAAGAARIRLRAAGEHAAKSMLIPAARVAQLCASCHLIFTV